MPRHDGDVAVLVLPHAHHAPGNVSGKTCTQPPPVDGAALRRGPGSSPVGLGPSCSLMPPVLASFPFLSHFPAPLHVLLGITS